MKNIARIAVAAVLAAAFSGCTASTGGLTSPAGFGPPQLWVDSSPPASELAEGFRLANPDDHVAVITGPEEPEVDVDATVRLGSASEGVAYGKDFACIAINKSWFAVNNMTVPATIEEAAPYLEFPDPRTDESAAWWLAVKGAGDPSQVVATIAALQMAGASFEGIQVSVPQSGAVERASIGADEPVVTVASALHPWREANNLETGSNWIVLADTCVGVTLHAAADGELGETFTGFLLTREGQELLARDGLSYPIDEPEAAPEEVKSLAPAPHDSAQLPAGSASSWIEAALTGWENAAAG